MYTTEDIILMEADRQEDMFDMPVFPVFGEVPVFFELDTRVVVAFEISGTPRCPEVVIHKAVWDTGELISPSQYAALSLQRRLMDVILAEEEQ